MRPHCIVPFVCALAGCAAVAEPLEPTDTSDPSALSVATSPFGVNAHLAREELLVQFTNIGIAWYRVDAEWSHNEPRDGVLDFTDTDNTVRALDARGAFIDLVVAYTPSWASGSSNTATPPRDPSRFIAYVREVVRRYRGVADCISIWNEPNLRQFWAGSRSQFIDTIFVPALRAVREEAPEMQTCGPDLSSAGNERDDWMGPILTAAGPLLDVITHHQYDGSDTPSGRAHEIELMHGFLASRGHGDKPLWITEIGWDSPRWSRSVQARYLRETMAAMQARPYWTKTFWYDSHGIGWGLLDGEGGAPTPSLDAYREVIAASPYAPGAPPPTEPPPTTPPPTTPPPSTPPPPTAPAGDTLMPDQRIAPNGFLASADGRFRLYYQGDGNVVLYGPGDRALWSSGTFHRPGVLVMQGDGNLVIYDDTGRAVWSSRTDGNPGSRLVVQGDGNVVVYAPGDRPIWFTGTAG